MGLFRRKSNKDAQPASPPSGGPKVHSIPGVPREAAATGDFDIVLRALVAQMAPASATLTELGNDVVRAGDVEISLGNMRAGWHARPAGERETWLRNAIYGFFKSELRDTSRLDLDMLRPGIRSQWTADLPALMGSLQNGSTHIQPADRVAMRPMADGLVRVLIWDTPTTMSLLNQSTLDEWGTDFDSLWPVAVSNLANEPSANGWGCVNDCAWISADSDDYTAERVFIDGFTSATGLDRMVLFHPHRTRLILADPANPESIATAATIALQEAHEPNPISLVPIVGNGLDWTPLVLPQDHPAAPTVDRLRLLENGELYDAQRQLLSRSLDENTVVAPFQAFEADGRTMTVCSWTEGVSALLPRTDLISLVTAAQDVKLVSWDEAIRVAGSRLVPTDLTPMRAHVQSFPTAEELASMQGI